MSSSKVLANHVSLLSDCEKLAKAAFGGCSIKHRTLLRYHCESPPPPAIGFKLAHGLYKQMARNFKAVIEMGQGSSSQEIWRMISPGTDCHPKQKKLEVGLERALVAAVQEAEDSEKATWWNQVPVASGLEGSAAGRRRAIDLVKDRGKNSYHFVELKLESDTPIYAALEILQYGFLWLLSKEHGIQPAGVTTSLLSAKNVCLSVLAPQKFYESGRGVVRHVDYRHLTQGINEALQQIESPAGGSLSFGGFKEFPTKKFNPKADFSKQNLHALLMREYPD